LSVLVFFFCLQPLYFFPPPQPPSFLAVQFFFAVKLQCITFQFRAVRWTGPPVFFQVSASRSRLALVKFSPVLSFLKRSAVPDSCWVHASGPLRFEGRLPLAGRVSVPRARFCFWVLRFIFFLPGFRECQVYFHFMRPRDDAIA